MEFRRSGQRDPRRRRVLTDLIRGRTPRKRSRRSTRRPLVPRKSQNYGDAEFLDEQLRLTDLVPQRMTVIVPLFLLGLLVIAGLEVLYAWMPRWAAVATDGRIAAFDLDGEGSLAVWFSSTVLLASALVAVVVYTVRRYKRDDYHGHYRVWLWAALCWFLLSVDEAASLHEGFKEMMTWLTGTRLLGDGSLWWATVYFFLLGGVGTRLLLDMRRCRLSSAAFLGVAVSYALAVVTQLGWILPESGARGVMLEEGAEMVGNLLLLLAMTLHARYVILDAEGLLPVRAAEPEVEENELDEEDDEEDPYEYDADEVAAEEAILFGQNVRVHSGHRTPRRPAHSASGSKVDAFTAGMRAAESSGGRKLTEQEKKALRRRLEKQRKLRERRSA